MTILLLLAGFLLPSGLHAKQFVDFCNMEMAAPHQTAGTDQSHCHPDPDEQPGTSHTGHDCEGSMLCACTVDEALLSRETGLITSSYSGVFLFESVLDDPFFSPKESIRPELRNGLSHHSPPLWLLYDTFLN